MEGLNDKEIIQNDVNPPEVNLQNAKSERGSNLAMH